MCKCIDILSITVENQKRRQREYEKEVAEREAELLRRYSLEKDKTLKENIRRKQENDARQMRALQRHQERVMRNRLAEQKRLTQEGHTKQANVLRAQIKAYEEKHIQELKKYPEELAKLKDYYDNVKREKMDKAEQLLKDMESAATKFRNTEAMYNNDMNHALNRANNELNNKLREMESQKRKTAENLARMEKMKTDLDEMAKDKIKESEAMFNGRNFNNEASNTR